MNDEIWEEVSTHLANRFVEECQNRDDDPTAVLERLLIDYIRGDDLGSKVTEMHAAIVNEEGSILEKTISAPLVQLLEEYDPAKEGKLTYDALKQLTEIDEEIAINPVHVTDDALPQATDVKRELIKAIARHQYDIVKKYQVRKIAVELLDIGRGHLRREYVEPVWADLTVLSAPDVKVTFLSDVETTLAWMDAQLDNRGDDAETDMYWLGSELLHSDRSISEEALNHRLQRVSLDINQLYSSE